jgi:hypothetical protein
MVLIKDEYIFTDNSSRIKLNEVCNLLRQSRGTKNQPIEITAITIETSLCFAVYHNNILIGFARVLSDYGVYSFILDIVIDEQYNCKNLGRKLIKFINSHQAVRGTTKILLTRDAQEFYSSCEFKDEDCCEFMFSR